MKKLFIIGPKTFACNNLDYCLILDGCSAYKKAYFLIAIFSSKNMFLAFVKLHFSILKIYLNVKCRNINSCVHDLEARLL